jgi:hypothetical protein
MRSRFFDFSAAATFSCARRSMSASSDSNEEPAGSVTGESSPNGAGAEPRAFEAGWFLAQERRIHGPFDLIALRTLAREGTLSPDDRVWRSGFSDWVPANKVPELFPKRRRRPLAALTKAATACAERLRTRTIVALGMFGPPMAAAAIPWMSDGSTAIVATGIGFALSLLVTTWVVHFAWSSVEDADIRPTPWQAAWRLWVPGYQLYWLFMVLPGFAAAHNDYVRHHELPNADLDARPLLAAAALTPCLALGLFWPLAALPIAILHSIVGTVAVRRTWDAIEALEVAKFALRLRA